MDAMDDMLLGEFDPEVDKERNAEFQRDLAAFQGRTSIEKQKNWNLKWHFNFTALKILNDL